MTMTTEELQRLVDEVEYRSKGTMTDWELISTVPNLAREVIALRAERDRLREALHGRAREEAIAQEIQESANRTCDRSPLKKDGTSE
ncbi:hypothetical protein [Salipiger thiooxidans]|uniref:hypothetical protein n=1 Tax=Salipiger thiooxidans TaxID=282683 RepID=UPI001CD684BE|nr:hypothetical protein [Salipiger thiooxidans]MCA0846103.1 hypothetical protein [Salipiger thiooxidans]